MNTLSIIIPAYNEERTIHLILDKVRDVVLINSIGKDIVIVNDGSTDGTVAAVERYMAANPGMGIRFIQQNISPDRRLPFRAIVAEACGLRRSCADWQMQNQVAQSRQFPGMPAPAWNQGHGRG